MKRHRVQTSSFSLQRHNQGKVQVISVSGYLGDDEFLRLEKQLEHLWQQHHWHLVLDCTALTFIAAVNFVRLSLAAQFLRKHQGQFRLVGLAAAHRELAHAVGFDPQLELQPNVGAALKSIESLPGGKRKSRNKAEPPDTLCSPAMNKNLELLLKLDELALLRKRLELSGSYIEEPGFEYLDEKIDKLRCQLPDKLLSTYDTLARQYSDPVTVLADGVCQGCEREVSTRLAVLAARSINVLQCEHCGRFIVARQNARLRVVG